jgi:hypothetical protein
MVIKTADAGGAVRSQRQIFFIALYILLVTSALFAAFSHWAYDDPFITYRYAENLAGGHGFVYNPEERVLSTTTPLFTLLLAAFKSLGADLPLTANLIGAFSLAAGAVFLYDLGRSWRLPLAGWTALALYPSFPLLISTLGSETPLYLACCLGAFAFYARGKYALAALLTAFAALARPDGLLVAGVLALDFTLRVRRPVPWKAVGVFLAPLLAWIGFAWAYFGSPLPVTLAAKQNQGAMGISTRFLPGALNLLQDYLARPHYLAAAALAGVGVAMLLWRERRWTLLFAWTLLYFAGYTALQVSGYFWYYAPLVPGVIILVSLGLAAILSASNRLRRGLSLVVGLALVTFAGFQTLDLAALRRSPDPRFPIYQAAGQWLAESTPVDAQVGTLEVGIIGYYSQRPMLDFAGLIQPLVAAQFTAQTTYEDAARWAVERFPLDYLVLHDGLMPQLETTYVQSRCTPVMLFPGERYTYTFDLVVYDCRQDA